MTTSINSRIPTPAHAHTLPPIYTHDDAMIQITRYGVFATDGADGLKRSRQIYSTPSPADIKIHILGRSSRLIVATPLLYNPQGFSSVAFYSFSSSDFKADPVLCALLYGRATAPGLLKGCKGQTAFLLSEYSNHLIKNEEDDLLTAYRAQLDRLMTLYDLANYGLAIEYFLCECADFVKASSAWDRQKVDLIDGERHRIQVKTTVNTRSGGYSSTNGQILI